MSSLVINSTGPVVRPARRESNRDRWFIVAITGLIAAAAFPSLRIDVGGLQVPLHVIPVVLALPTAMPRMKRIPSAVRVGLFAFTVLFAASVLSYGEQFGDLVKVVTSVLTMLTIAALVRNKGDFLAGVVAFSLSLVVMNARGITGGVVEHVGYQPLRGIANKNAYSIYALPAVAVAGFALMHFRQSKRSWAVLAAGILSSVFILFTGANRSGWGGILLIAGLIAIQARRWRALALVGVLTIGSYAVLSLFGTSETFDYQAKRTTEGYESDNLRQSLFLTAVEIGLEHPLLGISVQELPRELAKRTGSVGDVVDPHNFIGYIAGGAGLTTLMALFGLGFALWRRPAARMAKELLLAHDLVRILLVVFLFRGMFSREILSVAAFPIAFGLALGLALVEGTTDWDLVNTVQRPAKSRQARA